MVNLIIDAETTSLDPSENGRVTCISTYNLDEDKLQSFVNINEAHILRDFWNYIKELNHPNLITFNGSCFDMPYIIHRSIVNRQKVQKFEHTDLRQVVNSFFISYDKKAKGNLAYWAAVLGIEQKTPPGSHMVTLFMEGKLDEIKKHCEEDITITKKLYERCKEIGLLENKK